MFSQCRSCILLNKFVSFVANDINVFSIVCFTANFMAQYYFFLYNFQKKRLSIITSSSETDAGYSHSQSLSSLPSSPLSTNYSNSSSYQLSSSLASMSLSGNGLHSRGGSQSSSKSHSPAGSVASTLTMTSRFERSTTPNSGSESGDSRDAERGKVRKFLLVLICNICISFVDHF